MRSPDLDNPSTSIDQESVGKPTESHFDDPIVPTTKRGRRTRERLVAAAAEVLVRDGYLDTKITDISQTAGMSNGSFYTYFRSKAEILGALSDRINAEMYEASMLPREEGLSPRERIEQVNRSYVRAYRANAGLLGIIEQVSTFNNEFREMRRVTRETFRSRIERSLRRLADTGAIPPLEHPRAAADALTSMVSNFCYISMVLGENYDEDTTVDTLTTLWVRGIGLEKA